MCGRYTLTVDQEALQVALGVETLLHPTPRYNVAPTQEVPVLCHAPGGRDGRQSNGRGSDVRGMIGRRMRWGLIPHWARDDRAAGGQINARWETVHQKPTFRDAFRRQRCLVPADGFLEWTGEKAPRTPHWIQIASRRVFTFAGVWDRWISPSGEARETFTILTRDAVPALRTIHDRMPVLFAAEVLPEIHPIWLDPEAPLPEVQALLEDRFYGAHGEDFAVRTVSTRVNAPRNDDPGCLIEDASLFSD
jgi:putative SOS response-associated peptidase YedK